MVCRRTDLSALCKSFGNVGVSQSPEDKELVLRTGTASQDGAITAITGLIAVIEAAPAQARLALRH